MKKGYKETPIGMIPEDWKARRLDSLCEICYGKSQHMVADPIGKYGIYGTGGLIGHANKFLYDNPSVLIGRKGTIDKPIYLDIPFWSVDTMYYTKIKENIHAKWLFYSISTLPLKQYNEATGVPSLGRDNLNRINIPTPSFSEQSKIASILSTVDDKIDAINERITQTQLLKNGLMQRLLTKGIGHTKFKDSPIGEIPENWNVVKLGEYFEKVVGGGTPSRAIESYWNGHIPWATVKDLKKNILDDTEEYITEIGLKQSASNLIPKNTIVIATRMALGKAVFFTKEVAINQDLKAIFTKPELIKDFLFHWFALNAKKIEELGSGSTVKGIRLEVLRALELALPPISEQQGISVILSNVDEKLDILQEKKTEYEKLKKGLMQKLLTGQIRVNTIN